MALNKNRSLSVPSLIQGISQQSDFSRGLSSAKGQANCLNSVADGVVARMGSTLIEFYSHSFTSPFVRDIVRSRDELYSVVIEGGRIRAFNLVTGVEATITGHTNSYLDISGSSKASESFSMAHVEDTTFIANREVMMEMHTDRTDPRDKTAIFYFKSGNYKTTYTLKIIVDSVEYSATYETPDNSVGANEAFIKTDRLGGEFRDAMNNIIIPALNAAGKTGFTANFNGTTTKITSTTYDFDIDTIDGRNGDQFISFKDSVRKFSVLPIRCHANFIVKVAGTDKTAEDDYYVQFQGSPTTGNWVEVVAPDTEFKLDDSTMPHILVNTALDTFELKVAPWGERVAGDGIDTSLDPNYIGEYPRSLNFLSGRMSITTEVGSMMSRSRNGFVFFPDTAQTTLATDPIAYEAANGKVTILSHSPVVNERLQLWGDGIQITIDSGQDRLSEETVETKPQSAYDFDGRVSPEPLGLSSLVFGTKRVRHVRMLEVIYKNGKPQAEIVLTAHCKHLLKGHLTRISSGESSESLFAHTSDDPKKWYIYQWYNNGNERIQSAWNEWNFNIGQGVLWSAVIAGTAYFMVKWSNGVSIEKIELDIVGDEPDEPFPLRLDHRISEDRVTSTDASGYPIVTTPYAIDVGEQSNLICYMREDIDDYQRRGREIPIERISDTTIRVLDSTAGLKFHIGVIPIAYRDETQFFVKGQEGVRLPDDLHVSKVRIAHTNTISYKVRVTYGDGSTKIVEYNGRVLGDPSILNSDVPQSTSTLDVPVDAGASDCEITLINDTVFNSQWETLKYTYRITERD